MHKDEFMEKEGNEERKGLTNRKTCGILGIPQPISRHQTPKSHILFQEMSRIGPHEN